MSDTAADATSETQSTDTSNDDAKPADDLGPEGEKALQAWKERAKKAEAEARANRDKAKQLDSLQESTKSDLQKVIDRATAAETARDEAVAGLLRYQVASEKGLPADAVKLLTGTTRDEIEESADTVAGLIKGAAKGAATKPVSGLGKADENGAGSTAHQFAAAMETLGL